MTRTIRMTRTVRTLTSSGRAGPGSSSTSCGCSRSSSRRTCSPPPISSRQPCSWQLLYAALPPAPPSPYLRRRRRVAARHKAASQPAARLRNTPPPHPHRCVRLRACRRPCVRVGAVRVCTGKAGLGLGRTRTDSDGRGLRGHLGEGGLVVHHRLPRRAVTPQRLGPTRTNGLGCAAHVPSSRPPS